MPRRRQRHLDRNLTLRADEPLIGTLVDENGEPVVRYSGGDVEHAAESEADLQAALAVIGAWSDLDWDEFSADLDRIRHESRPTPPIEP
jgi:hypothetical protein